MNIAFFTDTYLPQLNGVTVSIENTTKQLRKKGHRVYIFAPRIKKYKDEDKDVIRLNSFKVLSSEPEVLFPLIFPSKNYKKTLSLPFDIVHGHGNGAFSLLGHQVARMKGVPYVMTFHTLHTRYTHYILNGRVVNEKMVATALKIFGNICSGVIAPSQKMKDELIRFGVKKTIEVIPNIINPENFAAHEKGFLRRRLKIKKDAPLLLSVGRLGKEKNFSFLIRMFSKITDKYPEARLVIVGQGQEEKPLKELIKKQKLQRRVHLAKNFPQEDMPKVYADADIFLFASQTETQGLTVLEAALAGLPLVIVDDEAFDQIVSDKNAFVLPLRQKDFVKKTQDLLENEEKRKEMGEASRSLASSVYSPEDIADKLLSYYNYIKVSESAIPKKRNIPKTTYRVLATASNAFEKFFK